MKHLAKSIASGKGFSLKQFVRIQAHARVARSPSTGMASGSFHFIGLLPNISFQCMAINPIPLCSTPLSRSMVPSPPPGSDAPRMGYLTMNNIRQLVMLLDEDTAVSTCPTVGVWIRFDEAELGGDDVAQSALLHPLTWAAAMRFLCAERVLERRFVADDTFVMGIIVGEGMRCYEFTALRGTTTPEPGMPFSFTLLDCTVKMTDGQRDPVICKLNAIKRQPTAADVHVMRTAVAAHKVAAQEVALSEEIMSEVPRSKVPVPVHPTAPTRPAAAVGMNVAPGTCSALQTAANAEQLQYEQMQQLGLLPHTGLLSAAGLEMGVPHSVMQYSFPASIIAMQQMQIQELLKRVAWLESVAHKNGHLMPPPASSAAEGELKAVSQQEAAEALHVHAAEPQEDTVPEPAAATEEESELDSPIAVSERVPDEVAQVCDGLPAEADDELHTSSCMHAEPSIDNDSEWSAAASRIQGEVSMASFVSLPMVRTPCTAPMQPLTVTHPQNLKHLEKRYSKLSV